MPITFPANELGVAVTNTFVPKILLSLLLYIYL